MSRRQQIASGRRQGLPERRCIASGTVRPKETMVRFVVGPDEAIVPDVEGRLPGRSLWLSAERDMLNTACAKNLFAKAARRKVVVPEGLAGQVEGLLLRRCLDLLGLARRAGQAVAGFEKAREWLRTGKVGLLLSAADGAVDGRSKLSALAAGVGGVTVVELFTAAELGATMGGERIVHVAIASGRLAEALIVDAGRLAGFRSGALSST